MRKTTEPPSPILENGVCGVGDDKLNTTTKFDNRENLLYISM